MTDLELEFFIVIPWGWKPTGPVIEAAYVKRLYDSATPVKPVLALG